ncbi:sulfotransferase domain-containing protein [Psychroserpens algicola]|uniref:Sulfotransferase domain-containing protein n=1 Tax=Psychroserpens algicola TaxID=1719034 RepID=A0ABT0HBP6_9FLAO|nr:sulfotransferase domain-containing protein [Psychroserpens algicola]MCK8481790.1 sulfotransferase domain-containing protein [Psychroserpens algicola]
MKLKQILGKFEHATRLLYINSVTLANESVLVVEYPKSGGTWLAQLISGCLNLPFPRNKYPILKKAVYHSHYQPKYLIDKNKYIVWLLRDGRDIMVSSYFHHLVWNDKNKKDPKLVNYYRSKLKFEDYSDIENNLATYIEFLFTDEPSKLIFFNYPGNWKAYNQKWLEASKNQKNVYLIRYEDMLKDTFSETTKLMQFFNEDDFDTSHVQSIVNKFSFENQTKRKPGEENTNSFLRKGISGDWKNHFNEDAKNVFKKHAGDMLIELGYEDSLDW